MAGDKTDDERPLSVRGAYSYWDEVWLSTDAICTSIGTFLDEETRLHHHERPPHNMQFNLWSERDDESD
jgi:hypothetical protein